MIAAAGRLSRVVPEPGVTGLVAWTLRLHAIVAALKGRRRIVVSIGLGALAALALPPVYALPVLVPAFTGLVWLTDRRIAGASSAFFVGWWFGLGFFLAGLYWVFNAFAVRGEMFVWIAPFAVFGLAALLAVFPAIACLVARLVGVTGIGAVLVLAAAWVGAEWLRSWAFTGFPWNMIGTVWAFSDSMVQVTALAGTYGLGLVTVIAAAMPSAVADRAVPRRRAGVAVVGAGAVLLAVWGGGMLRLTTVGEVGTVEDVRLRLVQPNIPQRAKWRRDLLDAHLNEQLALGAGGDGPPPTHVFWAETAAPLFLAEDAVRRQRIGRFTPAGGVTVVGTLRRSAPAWPYDLHNSLLAIDSDGDVVAEYDKVHLVPFGEYMPLRGLFGLGKLTEGAVDFSPGQGLRTLDLPGLPPAGPLICYEVIFPKGVTADERPDWLLNLTNDAWYGVSSGPYQHFAAARLRAVEEGLPLVRVANTGISAIVDPLGRVVASLGLEKAGVVDGSLARALQPPPPYARLGNAIVFSLLLATLIAGAVLGRRRG